MSVCVCVYLYPSTCTGILYIVYGETYTHNWNVKHICCMYMHATWSNTHTYILFINILFSINYLSSLPAIANKYYFLIMSIYNLVIKS